MLVLEYIFLHDYFSESVTIGSFFLQWDVSMKKNLRTFHKMQNLYKISQGLNPWKNFKFQTYTLAKILTDLANI